MMRFIAVALALLLPAAAADREVTLGEGAGALHGTLLTPDAAQFDAVLMISGSGPTDRDGNQAAMKNDSLKLVAEALRAAGVATLRFDKRGVAASAGAANREEDLRFDMYVEDARQWLRLLKSESGVRRIFVLGHSEGALIGAIVGQDGGVSGTISLAGAGLPAADILRRQIKASPNGEQVLALAEPTLQKLEKGELDPSPSPMLYALFRPSVQPYLISWFKVDPRKEIASAAGRVLILQGTTDLQVIVADAESLKAARPDATLTLIDGMNHVLKTAPEDRAANIAAYTDPDLPLASGLMDAIVGFVQAP